MLRAGGRVAAFKPHAREAAYVSFPGVGKQPTAAEVMGRAGEFEPFDSVRVIERDERYATAARAWEMDRDRKLFPSRNNGTLADALAAARKAGVLTRSASYAVFETVAQWKMVERTEKKTLESHESLSVAAVPEPSTAVLVGGGIAWLALRRRSRRSGS